MFSILQEVYLILINPAETSFQVNFSSAKVELIKTYFNKETPKIVIDKEGNPVMRLDGVIRLNRLKTDYLREKEYVYSLS